MPFKIVSESDPEEIIRRPTLIVLGLGEAGQKIMLSLEGLAYDLNIANLEDEWDVSNKKALIRAFREDNGNIKVTFVRPNGAEVAKPPVPAQEEQALITGAKENVPLARQLGTLRGSGTPTTSRTSRMILQECSDFTASDINAVIEELRKCSPVISSSYGFSMVRIDLDENTLRKVVERERMRGLLRQAQTRPDWVAFIPPGFSIISKETTVYDEYLEEYVTLIPTSGAQGRSSTVYYLLKKSEGVIILDVLGIRGEPNKRNPFDMLSYRTILLIHGLVGSGAGAASVILEQLRDLVNKGADRKDLLKTKLIMDLVVVPSAGEKRSGKLDPNTWKEMVQWDVKKVISFITEEPRVLDTSFVVDLDFALLQYKRHQLIKEQGIVGSGESKTDGRSKTNEITKFTTLFTTFIKELLDGKVEFYSVEKFREMIPNLGDLTANYDQVDDLIAYSLEPVMCILGPRGVRFGSGGSSVDLSELKGMISGYAVVPMVSTMEVFQKYLDYSVKLIYEYSNKSKKSEHNSSDYESSDRHNSSDVDIDVEEEAVASLLIPPIHGLLAPVLRDITERLIVVVNIDAVEEIEEKLNITVSSYDIVNALQGVFRADTDVRVWVSSTARRTSVVIYALSDPKVYFENIISKKGWD